MTTTSSSDRTGLAPVIPHVIDGEPVEGGAERTLEVSNPATGETTGVLNLADAAVVDAAVRSARTAALSWAQTPVGQRAEVLFAFRALVKEHAGELAAIVTREHGKTLTDARGEVARGLEVIDFACGVPHLLKGSYSEQVSGGVDVYSFRQPVGVVAGITPFNFPVMVPLWMAPTAIATGNAFILKPSERDPSAAVRLAQLWAEAGLPAGVFNVVHGDKVAVDALLTHPGVDAVSFVGSTPIARYVHQTAGAHGKRVQALGGAKNHAVVLPDADLGHVADHLAAAGYGSAGQRCMAVSAVVAVGDIADDLVRAVADRTQQVRVGPGTADDMDMGPLISSDAVERVRGAVTEAADAGATVVVDGRGVEVPGHPDGNWVGPTLLDNVGTDMRAYAEEIFGPVLAVLRVPTLDAAIELVNANPYGNGAAIFTSSGEAARRFQREVSAGMVGVNVPIPVPVGSHSFGGWKDSLFGDLHMYGPEGIAFYTRAKVVTSRWPHQDNLDAASYGFPTNSPATPST